MGFGGAGGAANGEARAGGGEQIVCIGHSHVKALADARALLPDGGAGIAVIAFWTEPGAVVEVDGARRLSPSTLERVARADRVVACMGGSAHTVAGLVEHARPFDVAAAEPGPPGLDLAPDPGRELVPHQGVRATLAAVEAPYLDLVAQLRAATRASVTQLGAPPPVRDAGRIAPHVPWGFYPGQPRRIAPAALRWKLWRMQAAAVAQACAALGCGFSPAPADASGPDGFLRPELDVDGVHASAQYGRLALRDLGLAP